MTRKGEAFISVAHKWLNIWQEAREINKLDGSGILNIASVGSVSSYILPDVFYDFAQSNPDARICFHNYHSFESYRYIDSGLLDIAFISDDIYYKNVETIPAFSEPMVFVGNSAAPYPEQIPPSMLNPRREIQLPWNPEYNAWHAYWFHSKPEYLVSLDQMDLLESILCWKDTWAVVPMSVAGKVAASGKLSIHRLESPPPDRIIYYLRKTCRESDLVSGFLTSLHRKLQLYPHVTSYLG